MFLTSSAPELQDSTGYKGQPADIWSLGVITYALLSGTTPFRNKGDDAAGLLREQMTEKLDFSRTIWNGISEQAKGYLPAPGIIHRHRELLILSLLIRLHHPMLQGRAEGQDDSR